MIIGAILLMYSLFDRRILEHIQDRLVSTHETVNQFKCKFVLKREIQVHNELF